MRQRWMVAAMVLGVALAGGCAKKPNDAALVTSIQAKMFSDPQLKDSNLQVTASQGVVILSGAVPNNAAHLEAYKIATQAAGVVSVNDQITEQEAAAAPPPPPAPKPEEPAPRPEKSREKRVRKPAPAQEAVNTPPPAPQVPPQQPEQQLAPQAAPAPQPPTPPEPTQVDIPVGSTVTIRMIDGVDSSVNQPGEIFHASLDVPLVVGNQVVVPKGADVYVRLVSAKSAGRMTGKSELRLELVKLEFQGQSYPLVSSTYTLSGSSRGKNTAEKVGAGAILGTLIGAIAGGGKGAAIGAGVGAAGGGVYQAATHGQQVKIPSETKLDFKLEHPVTVTVMPQTTSQ